MSRQKKCTVEMKIIDTKEIANVLIERFSFYFEEAELTSMVESALAQELHQYAYSNIDSTTYSIIAAISMKIYHIIIQRVIKGDISLKAKLIMCYRKELERAKRFCSCEQEKAMLTIYALVDAMQSYEGQGYFRCHIMNGLREQVRVSQKVIMPTKRAI